MIEQILGTLSTIVLFFVILGVLVVIHELGHFIVARLANVRVLEFGIGFPPRAKVLRSDGETLYTLNWLPIGGFVRLEGEDGDSDDPRSFVSARLPIKMVILVAGVVMNLILAFAIFAAIAWLPSRSIALEVGSVQPNSPAFVAGIAPGDRVSGIDGRQFDKYDFEAPTRMVELLRANAGRTLPLEVWRVDGTVEQVVVTLRPPAEAVQQGALGVGELKVLETPFEFTRSPAAAIGAGIERTVEAFGLILDGLGQIASSIATRPTEAPPAAGPIGIAVQIGDVFREFGPIATLYLAGILSANLALVNILPFPPLDGGRMLMLILKSVAGTRISLQAERLTYLVGFGFLFAFLIWITYFDIARLGSGQ